MGEAAAAAGEAHTAAFATEVVRRMFPEAAARAPAEVRVAVWGPDTPHARGAYSFYSLESTPFDVDKLSRPVGPSLYFAGEATHPDYQGSAAGAFLSGVKAAHSILDMLNENNDDDEVNQQQVTHHTTEEAASGKKERASSSTSNIQNKPAADSTSALAPPASFTTTDGYSNNDGDNIKPAANPHKDSRSTSSFSVVAPRKLFATTINKESKENKKLVVSIAPTKNQNKCTIGDTSPSKL